MMSVYDWMTSLQNKIQNIYSFTAYFAKIFAVTEGPQLYHAFVCA